MPQNGAEDAIRFAVLAQVLWIRVVDQRVTARSMPYYGSSPVHCGMAPGLQEWRKPANFEVVSYPILYPKEIIDTRRSGPFSH